MSEKIAQLIRSTGPEALQIKGAVFEFEFQTVPQWSVFITRHAQPLLIEMTQRVARAGFSPTIGMRAIAALPNSQLAKFLEDVIVPLVDSLANINALPRNAEVGEFVTRMQAARCDIVGLATRLRTDVIHAKCDRVERVSEEIRVNQDVLVESLQAFQRALTA